ncbi:MAG: hypothetical protein WCM93_16305 [Bacteroidota bacterium]
MAVGIFILPLPLPPDLSAYAVIEDINTPAQIPSIVLLAESWVINSGIYEYALEVENLTTESIVDVIPNNEDIEIVQAACIFPRIESSTGILTLYAKNAPTDDITVTLNIYNHVASVLITDSTHRLITEAEVDSWNSKASAPVQVESLVLLAISWSLVSGYYEYELSDSNIHSTSIVEVIPDNEDAETIQTAGILPKTVSSEGSVTLYSKNAPASDITVTINIF